MAPVPQRDPARARVRCLFPAISRGEKNHAHARLGTSSYVAITDEYFRSAAVNDMPHQVAKNLDGPGLCASPRLFFIQLHELMPPRA